MASIHKEKRGDKTYYRLQFYDKDNRRRSIRLGDVNRRSADAIRVKVEDLLSASIAGNTPSNETSRWLSDIGKDLAAKLTTAGFGKYIPKRESAKLGAFLTAYIEGRKAEVAESTVTGCIRPFRFRVGWFVVSRSKFGVVGWWGEGYLDGWFISLLVQGEVPRMANREELAGKLARQVAVTFSEEVYGPDGPRLDCDIDEIEDLAVLAAQATFDAVIARALVLQNQKLPDQLPCPKCERPCRVNFKKRTVQGRMGPAEIQEPVCHCSVCDRDFFPSAGNIAAR